MTSGSDPQAPVKRLEQLEARCDELGRRCRTLRYALAIVLLVSLATPAFIALRTSGGSELKIGTLVANRLIVPYGGELIVEGIDPENSPKARLGHFSEGDWFGLALFDGKTPAVQLRGGQFPSLNLQAERGGLTRLRLGYTGDVRPDEVDVVGEPMVELVGHEGTRQATLSITGNDYPHFVLFDSTGKKRCMDMAVSDGSSHIALRPAKVKPTQNRLELSSDPKVELFNEKGEPIAPK